MVFVFQAARLLWQMQIWCLDEFFRSKFILLVSFLKRLATNLVTFRLCQYKIENAKVKIDSFFLLSFLWADSSRKSLEKMRTCLWILKDLGLLSRSLQRRWFILIIFSIFLLICCCCCCCWCWCCFVCTLLAFTYSSNKVVVVAVRPERRMAFWSPG